MTIEHEIHIVHFAKSSLQQPISNGGDILAALHLSCDWGGHCYLFAASFLLLRNDWRCHGYLLCAIAVSRHIVAKNEASHLCIMPLKQRCLVGLNDTQERHPKPV